jgi:predicted ABC-type ATPase
MTSFSLETTLSGRGVFKRIEQARTSGFWIRLIYVGLNSSDTAIERVAARALGGGHAISDDVVRRRYVDSLKNLPRATVLADEAVVFDNSQRFREHFRKTNGQLYRVTVGELPEWLNDFERRVQTVLARPSVPVKA